MSWAYKLFVTSLVNCHKIHSLLCIDTFLASAPPVMAAAAAAAGFHNSSHFRESLFLRFELWLAVWNICHDLYCTFISVTKIIFWQMTVSPSSHISSSSCLSVSCFHLWIRSVRKEGQISRCLIWNSLAELSSWTVWKF